MAEPVGVQTKSVVMYLSFVVLQTRRSGLSNETTRNLLICFLWVVKNMEKDVLRQWWLDLPVQRLRQMLEVLNICISCFEYKVVL